MVGSHGIETRYPFLDQDVVQEYLWWLTSSANNFEYKRPVAGFITHEGLRLAEFVGREANQHGGPLPVLRRQKGRAEKVQEDERDRGPQKAQGG